MANTYEPIENKKFLNANGVGHLWEKIRDRYDPKLDEVKAKDKSIAITNKNEIAVALSADADNQIELKNDGLFVPAPAAADTYSIAKDSESGEYAAVYHLQKRANGTGDPVNVGDPINIIKDKFLKHSEVVVKSEAGDWGEAGTYMHFEMQNGDDLWVDVSSLIEYVTSGSQEGDMIMIAVDPNTHKVTATVTDGTITKAKLTADVQALLNKADTAVQSVTEGATNGTINVDDVEVPVHGLDTAAYQPATAFDAAGAADAVLGTDSDAATAATVYGVKKYASDAYAAIQALTDAEIDAAIATANADIDA